MATVLGGAVHCLVLTGGLAQSERLVETLSKKIEFIAPIQVHPGELEMEAMAEGVLRVLNGEEAAAHYRR